MLPMVDAEATGRNIKRLRMRNGYSVTDIQRIFGFNTPQAIYKWQQGKAMPSIDNLVWLAIIFKCSVDDIVVVRMEDKNANYQRSYERF